MAAYDSIGRSYSSTRQTDPRIAAHIWAALGEARTVVNVGAGTGNYEPPDRDVTAVEPSAVMLAQRPPDAAPAVQASAEALPFADASFDAAMAVLTLHHWTDWRAGCAELRRVARDRVVVLSWDPDYRERMWLFPEYFPSYVDEPFPSLAEQAAALEADVDVVPVPWDCRDGFMSAFWRRPEAYLDPAVRAGISSLAKRTQAELADGIARLRADLDSGAWARRHADLLELDEIDLGYRLLVGVSARYCAAMPQPKSSSSSSSTRARKPAAKRTATTRAKTTRASTKAARAPAKSNAAKPSAATTKAEANLKSLRTTLSRGVVVTQGHIKDALDEAVKAGKLSRKEATELARNIVAAGRKQADGIRKDIDQVLSRKP